VSNAKKIVALGYNKERESVNKIETSKSLTISADLKPQSDFLPSGNSKISPESTFAIWETLHFIPISVFLHCKVKQNIREIIIFAN
jgi:hypothetical protein